MTITIALAGKGGTGKTTIAALLIRALLARTTGAVLAIDADPATNLHLALGLPMPATVGEVREGMRETSQAAQLGVSISRIDYLSREVRLAIEEGDRVDLLAMGRPEGQGCYCAVNHLLREVVDGLGRSYAYVVIDNEAGMEHISRRTTRDVDTLLIVTDPTVRGVRTAGVISEMAKDVEVNVRQALLIINRVEGELPETLRRTADDLHMEVAALIPADGRVNALDAEGTALARLETSSPAWAAIDALAKRLIEASRS